MSGDEELSTPAPGPGTAPQAGAGGTRCADGLAIGPDLDGAAEVALGQALSALGTRPDLVCFFVAPGPRHGPQAVEEAGRRIMERTAGTTTIGATSGGVIGDGRGVERGPAVAVFAATLPGAALRPVHLRAAPAGDGVDVDGLPVPDGERVAALLADPYSFPVGPFLRRCDAALPGFTLVGGLAGAPGGPGANRLFLDGTVHPRGAVGVLLGGGVAVRTVVSQGCRPVGPAMVVTRAERNLLVELAGKPAYARLAEIVAALPPAERALVGRGLHLGIAMDEYADDHGRGDFLIRGVLGVDDDSGVVAVGDVVEVGQTVRFQVRDAEAAGEDLAELLDAAVTAGPGPVRGALLFSCNGRGTTMFPSADHDVQVVRGLLGEGAGVAGFFAAGEIGPVGGRNHLHGFTASLLTFS